MSQSNESFPFTFTVQRPAHPYNFDGRNAHRAVHQWAPGSRSIQHSLPSPNGSLRSVNTTPILRPSDRASFQQSRVSTQDVPVDPSIINGDFDIVNASGQPQATTFTANADSWNTYNMRSSASDHLHPLDATYKKYPNGPGSTGSYAPRSDSGYQSQSVLSNERGSHNAELQPLTMSRVSSQNREPDAVVEIPHNAHIRSDQRSQVSSRSGAQDKTFICPECNESSKCKSEFKKHMLRHDKPFKCDYPGCKRGDQGFTTVNDLDRHKKSVHRIGVLDKSYQCASTSCRNKEKIWPRLDNFKQHIERMHRDEDHIELIKRSAYTPAKQSQVQHIDTVSPRDLAGMGSTFAGQNASFPGSWPPAIDPSELSVHALDPVGTSSSPNSGDASTYSVINSSNPSLRPIRMPPNISQAPQTKAQQNMAQRQRQTGAKRKGGTDSADSPYQFSELGQSILKILSKNMSSLRGKGDSQGSHMQVNSATLETVKALTDLFNKNSHGSTHSQSRRANHGYAAEPQVCHICGYAVARPCDLRKHMKRHDKPYGCTYAKCHKRFGAKSDWKRHENSQHFQLEAYRCRQPKSNGSICGEHFLRLEHFEKHLEASHKMVGKEAIDEETRVRKLGKNCQRTFWCGFCQDIIPLMKKRNNAWDERFDHIANHFQKEKKTIEAWVCVEANKTKQELLQEMDRYIFDDEDERDPEETNDMTFSATQQSDDYVDQDMQQIAGTKRTATTELHSGRQQPRRRTASANIEIQRFCCQCNNGPFGPMTVACSNCMEQLCEHCTVVQFDVGDRA